MVSFKSSCSPVISLKFNIIVPIPSLISTHLKQTCFIVSLRFFYSLQSLYLLLFVVSTYSLPGSLFPPMETMSTTFSRGCIILWDPRFPWAMKTHLKDRYIGSFVFARPQGISLVPDKGAGKEVHLHTWVCMNYLYYAYLFVCFILFC